MKVIKLLVSDGIVDYPREFIGGAATFMTMAYIIFVNPAILSTTGMDFKAVTAATCLASAFATILMAFLAKYPIALAPGMGLNAFFALNICAKMNVPWQVALGMVFIEGIVFTLLTFFKIREMIIDAVPASLKLATSAGIGLFIAFIGLKDAGIVVADKNIIITLGKLGDPAVILALSGLLITSALMALNVKGAILIGILLMGAGAVLSGMIKPGEITAMPDLGATFFQLDITGALKIEYLAPIFVLFFFDLFDSTGTLIGVAEQGGFMRDGKLPRATRALTADAIGTAAGAVLGTSTVTSYIESTAGVASGARTGVANLVTAALFIAAMFFTPVAELFGSGVKTETGILQPVTAPALIIVGCLMMGCLKKIPWERLDEAIPSFLVMLTMPLTFSISHGLAAGFISYPLIKVLSGKGGSVHILTYILGALFVLRYIFLP